MTPMADVQTIHPLTGTKTVLGINSRSAISVASKYLHLAASPTFAIMALVMGTHAGGMPDMLCAAMHEASPLTGMVAMYVLMSLFHASPWLKLVSGRWEEIRPE